jgi:small subunit ribosomal protein S9
MPKTVATNYFKAVGRRKSATANVRLSRGTSGKITINQLPAEEYFATSKYLLAKLQQPFGCLELENKFNITILVAGGGHNGQAEAIRLGITKALVQVNEDYRSTLKRAGLLERNSREKERKKFGLRGARKQRQFTKR